MFINNFKYHFKLSEKYIPSSPGVLPYRTAIGYTGIHGLRTFHEPHACGYAFDGFPRQTTIISNSDEIYSILLTVILLYKLQM